jgi:hypothetical protein
VTRWAVRAAVFVFWACTAAWLVRYEAFPEYFTRTLGGYSGLLSRDVLVADSWMRIRFGAATVGYSHTSMDTMPGEQGDCYLLNNRTQVNVTLLGQPRGLHASATATLDPALRLQKFTFVFSTPGYRASVAGARAGPDRFDVKTDTAQGPRSAAVRIPDDVIVHSPVAMLSLRRLRPGREVSIATLDPLTLKRERVLVQALRVEELNLPEGPRKATVLSADYHGMKFLTWIDARGEVLRQESPFGWVVEKCTREQAMAAADAEAEAPDLLKIAASQFLSVEM